MISRPVVNRNAGGIVKIKIYDDEKTQTDEGNSKVVALKDLNFLQDLPSLTRYLEMAIRKSPTDPIYSVQKVVLKARDKPALDLTADMFDRDMQAEIYTFENVQLTLHVTSRQSSRCRSRGRGREVTGEGNENVNDCNKTASGVRSASPSVKKRGQPQSPSRHRPTNSSKGSLLFSPPRREYTSSAPEPFVSPAPANTASRTRGVLSPIPALSTAAQARAEASSEYRNGGTQGEAVQQWMTGLRGKHAATAASSANICTIGSPAGKPQAVIKRKAKKIERKEEKSDEPGPPSPQSPPPGPLFLGKQGRPSIETMAAQWEFMRSNFVNAGEDIEWLMISRREGARAYASSKNEKAEDTYFRSTFEASVLEKQVQILQDSGPNGVIALLTSVAACVDALTANPHDVDGNTKVATGRKKLKELFHISQNKAISGPFIEELETVLEIDEKDSRKFAKKCGSCLLPLISAEVKSASVKLDLVKKQVDESLEQMELWSKREKETADYASFMAQEEDKWLKQEYIENHKALETMRKFIPTKVSAMSVDDILNAAKDAGGMMSFELASEIKANRLLQWLVMHPDDIALTNFLAGDKKMVFENIEILDVVELRALACWIPTKFEFDYDCKKSSWRSRLLQRARLVVSQATGELVKGSWDAKTNKRAMVQMPPLKPELLRRPVYFYSSMTQCLKKIQQYESKESLLADKSAKLMAAEELAAVAKKEFDQLLAEIRDPQVKCTFSPSKLVAAKQDAKREMQTTEDKRKQLKNEVTRLQKSIADAPFTKEEFTSSFEEMKAFFARKEISYDENTGAIPIEGVFTFSADDIKQVARSAAKFLNPEEEAELRRLELSSLGKKQVITSPGEVVIETNGGHDHHHEATPVTSCDLPEMVKGPTMVTPGPIATVPGVKNKVLASANPDMIAKLSSMFASPIATISSVFSPSNLVSQAKSTTKMSDQSESQVQGNSSSNIFSPPAAPACVKSKFLSRYTKPADSSSTTPGADASATSNGISPMRSPLMGFLAQIKARGPVE